MRKFVKENVSFSDIYKRYGIFIVLLVLILCFTALKNSFINPSNLVEILRQISFTGIIAVGMTFTMLAGGFDLSVGSNVALGLVVCAMFMSKYPIPLEWFGGFNINPIIGAILGILATTLVGVLNGFFITNVRISPMITTLATLAMVRGLVFVITGAMPIYDGFEKYFTFIGQGNVFGVIPFPVIVMVITFVLAHIILTKTVFGVNVYGVGGNEEAARLSGINVKKIKYMVYGICGFLCGIAAVMLLARLNSGQPRAGTNYEFETITACVLSGVSFSGGEGKVSLVFAGVAILGVLFNGMIQVGLSEFYQQIMRGAVLLLAVGIDELSKNKKRKLKQAV